MALLSSYETKILIQANRPPLFYHFPDVELQAYDLQDLSSDAAQTPAYLADSLNNLQELRPEYVFMEKVFLQDKLPSSYQENNPRVLGVVAYIKAHYQALSRENI